MIAFGMKIIESTAACQYTRVRTYAKRRAKSPRHWARMDKKYLKRYGMRVEPGCYQMGDTLVVHPALIPELRRSMREVQQDAYGSFGL